MLYQRTSAGGVVLLIAAALAGFAIGAEPAPEQALAHLVEQAKRAESPGEAVAAYEALLRSANEAAIRRLELNDHPGIALWAAWQRVVGSISPDIRPYHEEDLNAAQMQRFLGFVEGRLKIDVPEWWEQVVASGKAYDRQHYSFGVTFNKPWRYRDIEAQTGYPLRVPPETEITQADQVATIAVGEHSLQVPAAFLKEKTWRVGNTLACFSLNSGRAYMATFFEAPGPALLLRLEPKSGKVIWESSIWSANCLSMCGVSVHFLSIQDCHEEVFIFGASGEAVYLEVFDAHTGKSVCRFSTFYHTY